MSDTFRLCKKCGKPIGIIQCGLYRKVLVDATAVMVMVDPKGDEIFIDIEGRKILGREFSIEEGEHSGMKSCAAYRPHAKTCGVDG